MKQIGCRDMGVNCDFVAKGSTDEEIKRTLWTHAETSHGEAVKILTPDKKKEMNAKMDALLKQFTAAPVKR